MKKLLLLLILSFFSAQGYAASCPDGSEPVKSVSDDGTYFVYNCGGQSSSSSVTNSKAGTVKVAMKPFSGDWLNESIYPHSVKKILDMKYRAIRGFAMGDFDNDGIDDLFMLGDANIWELIGGNESTDDGVINVACDVSSGNAGCYSKKDHNVLNIFSMKENVTYEKWNEKKYKMETVTGFQAVDVSKLVVDNNPIDMMPQAFQFFDIADFNGDGVLDVFIPDAGIQSINGKRNTKRAGKNDNYYLSQADGTWLESTVTHVTGHGVKNGRGLKNFSHGSSVGDIDGDGDIDIVITSLKWVGNKSQLLCYVNQGDGHMIIRRCSTEFGWKPELGDIDNDGDLDIVFGGTSYASSLQWADVDGMNHSSKSRSYNGILLNDGKGNFNKRGFEFDDVMGSNGFWYSNVPTISVADFDGDGDLDVVRSLVGRLYQGMAMSIEENIGNGQFRTAFLYEPCVGSKTKAEWSHWEGDDSGNFGCWAPSWMLGDFNKDGFVDLVVEGKLPKFDDSQMPDGTVFLSTGKFTYDKILPVDADYPLADFTIGRGTTMKASSEQDVEDELAAFEAELAAELGQ